MQFPFKLAQTLLSVVQVTVELAQAVLASLKVFLELAYLVFTNVEVRRQVLVFLLLSFGLCSVFLEVALQLLVEIGSQHLVLQLDCITQRASSVDLDCLGRP
jgi:hypothetical protein